MSADELKYCNGGLGSDKTREQRLAASAEQKRNLDAAKRARALYDEATEAALTAEYGPPCTS